MSYDHEGASAPDLGQGTNAAAEATGGASAPAEEAQAALARFENVPVRHRVFKPDGTFDAEATLDKVNHSRRALELRMSTGDVRPKSVDDYVLNVPEELKALSETLDPEQTKAFRQEIFDKGITQDQYDFMMGKYLQQLPVLAKGFRGADEASAREELSQVWRTPQEFDANISRANMAIRAYAGDDAEAIFRDFANDPRIARTFAKIGAEMGEGRAPSMATSHSGDTEDSLRSSEAYRNAKHPDHERVSRQLRAMMERKHGTNPLW